MTTEITAVSFAIFVLFFLAFPSLEGYAKPTKHKCCPLLVVVMVEQGALGLVQVAQLGSGKRPAAWLSRLTHLHHFQ